MQHFFTPFAAFTAAFDVAHKYASSCMQCSKAGRDAHAPECTWEGESQTLQPRPRHHPLGNDSHPGMAVAMWAPTTVHGVLPRPVCDGDDAKTSPVSQDTEGNLQLKRLSDRVERLERNLLALQLQVQELASCFQLYAEKIGPSRLHLSAAKQSEEGPRRDSAAQRQCGAPRGRKDATSLPDAMNGRDAFVSSQSLSVKDPLAESWGRARRRERPMYSAHERCFWCGKKGFRDHDHPCRSHRMQAKRRMPIEGGESHQ